MCSASTAIGLPSDATVVVSPVVSAEDYASETSAWLFMLIAPKDQDQCQQAVKPFGSQSR